MKLPAPTPTLKRFWILLFAILLLPVSGLTGEEWVQEDFKSFANGTLGNAGHNLYVTKQGTLQTINRYDINQDGHLDLVFNSTHDWTHYLPATLAKADKDGHLYTDTIAVMGSQAARVEDFNRDGHLDVAFLPNRQNVQGSRVYMSIAYGDGDGWPTHRIQRPLPLHAPSAMETADLDLDGWPDLVVAMGTAWQPGQPKGKIVRIFWGSSLGFQLEDFTEMGISSTGAMSRGDFDGDGNSDIALLTAEQQLKVFYAASDTPRSEREPASHAIPFQVSKEPGEASAASNRTGKSGNQAMAAADVDGDGRVDLVFGSADPVIYIWNGQPGRSWGELQELKAFPATQITAGDLDGDNLPELILTHLKLSQAMGGEAAGAKQNEVSVTRILWSGPRGYRADSVTELEIPAAIHTAVGNFNGDAHADLAVAVHQGSTTMQTQSFLFYGTGDRELQKAPQAIATIGATESVIIPHSENRDRVLFTNSLDGHLAEAVPIRVFWGSDRGFDPENRWEIPMRSGYESSAADLNLDGHTDLLLMNSGHAGPDAAKTDPELGLHIYWGGPEGTTPGLNKFEVTRRTLLREPDLGGSAIADLNKDGYLDLILGAFFNRETKDSDLVIYYGSKNGYDKERRTALHVPGYSLGPLPADLNGDGWLDLSVAGFNAEGIWTFYGGPGGYSTDNSSFLYTPSALDLEAADLNRDGYLDLVASSYYEKTSGVHDAGLRIFWGSEKGYSHDNAQWLPGMATVGLTIADMDGDNYLDLFAPQYHAEGTREYLPSYLYWGGPDGFHPRNLTALIVHSAHDAQAADFNRDGLLDLAVSSHSNNNGHLVDSKVFYNDGDRFTDPEIQELPTTGTHFMWVQDMGNLMDRSLEEVYTSEVFQWDRRYSEGELNIQADNIFGPGVDVMIRQAAALEGIPEADWEHLDRNTFRLGSEARALQYKLLLQSDFGSTFPEIQRVHLRLSN